MYRAPAYLVAPAAEAAHGVLAPAVGADIREGQTLVDVNLLKFLKTNIKNKKLLQFAKTLHLKEV